MKGRLGIPTLEPGGKLGNVVFIRSGDGYLVRERITPANPRSPRQTATRREFAIASQGWKGLSDEAFAAWNAYGASLGRTPYNVYMGLSRKWLAVHKDGTPPAMPPTAPFFGDAVRLTLSLPLGRGRGGVESTSEGETNPHPSLPQGGGGQLVIQSDRPNSPGVVTEILVQPLPHVRRKPKARDWKTAGYFAFGAEPVEIPLPPGAYAVGYRFVSADSGLDTAMAELGAVILEVAA